MASTIAAVADDVATYFGYDSASACPSALQTRILADINSVRQQMFLGEKSDFHITSPAGDYLRGPVTLATLNLTFGSTTISGGAFASWMDGCQCVVGDDPANNRINQTGASTYVLESPYIGTTTTNGAGTVWQDVLNRPMTALSIERPVMLEGYWELLPMTNLSELRNLFRPYASGTDYGERLRYEQSGYPVLAFSRTAAVPRQYMVDSRMDYNGNMGIRIRFNPMPDKVYPVRWVERSTPAPVSDIADTTAILCPHRFEESVFMPLLREELSSYPLFQGDSKKIATQAEAAMKILNETARTQEAKDTFVRTQGRW